MNNHRETKDALKNKTVVITGASSGVGKAAALAFAQAGAKLVLAARREEALKEVVAECESSGGKAMYQIADVTDAEAVKALAQTALDYGGSIDVWVNNAGVLAAGNFAETPVSVHDQVIKTNLMGYLHGAHAVIPIFKQQGHGILINNISVGGWYPTPYAVGYSASKFGLRGFSESLRAELKSWPQIYICDLFPAFLDTPGIQHAANYTGSILKPAPPVYDPQKVAHAMVQLAQQPRTSKTVGSVATFLRLAHFLFPGLATKITAGIMQAYFKQAEPASATSGNLFQPVEFGTGIHGGWQMPKSKKRKLIATALLTTVIAAGLIASRKM